MIRIADKVYSVCGLTALPDGSNAVIADELDELLPGFVSVPAARPSAISFCLL